MSWAPMVSTPGTPATEAEIGPFITGAHIEKGILKTLRLWLPSYLSEGERKCGMTAGSLPTPRGWAITGRGMEKYNSDQLPCIVVMAGGIVLKPLPQGYPGVTDAVFVVDVGCIFNAAWGYDSREYAQLYVRAIVLTLLQRPLESDVQCSVDWTGENYDELDFSDTRTYSASAGQFLIEVQDLLWRDGGPPPYVSPPTDPDTPFDDWTQVAETDITVENTPPDDS